ncbi:MAG: leucine/isoleucine/valine transporter permease subunit [Anaerolineae bacterium]|nr:leucine/isoleucine/valine transporter permease subunit [Anaerolineae bacterium]
MIDRNTLRLGAYAAVASIIMALTAMFGKFQTLTVVGGQLSLSYVLLVVLIISVGYMAGAKSRARGAMPAALNGLVGSLIVGGALVVLVVIEANVDLTFVFPDLKTDPIGPVLTFGQELLSGCLLLLVASMVGGFFGGLLHTMSPNIRRVTLVSLGMTVVVGLLESQINEVMTLPDSLALALVFGAAYLASRFASGNLLARLAVGVGIGLIAGLILGLLANGGGRESGGVLRGLGTMPRILAVAPGSALIPLMLIFAVVGVLGALVTSAAPSVHSASLYVIGVLLLLGVLNWQISMTYLAAVITVVLLALMLWFIPPISQGSQTRFENLEKGQQRLTWQLAIAVGLLVMIAAPAFLGQYITSILDLVGLYIVMGIGLNVVVGYAGLLDLGYVAFFALGAYTVGILTTPSLLTCGGLSPKDIPVKELETVCTGVMTFWQAWPFAILVAGLAGVLLGIPVLRLRGDYLAIVTLGFGEIIRLLALSSDLKPLLGAAQGISNIPGPVLDLTAINSAWRFELGNALNIYYLILVCVIVVAFIAIRLSGTRLGRAWRSMRADEDVAQAMGINLVRTKLLAFAIGAAFAGMGGAIFGSWLKGIFPNSFTLAVSINVLSLIIIGGLGSIPGVVLGALILMGLPEVLRELQDYRLLAFGLLLVVTMLLKPEGLVPPPIRRLSQAAEDYRARREA